MNGNKKPESGSAGKGGSWPGDVGSEQVSRGDGDSAAGADTDDMRLLRGKVDAVLVDCTDKCRADCEPSAAFEDCGREILLESEPILVLELLFEPNETCELCCERRVEVEIVDSRFDLAVSPLCFPFDFFVVDSGIPSHLLFTAGTCAGNFCEDTPESPTVFALPPFSAAFFFSCSANCSHAEVEGSFSVKKPSTELFFFFGASVGLRTAAFLYSDAVEYR